MSIKVVGIDLAKNYFQVCVLNIDGAISSSRKVHRDRLLHTIRQLPDNPPLAMESCASSHYWGRVFLGLGLRCHLYQHNMLSHSSVGKRTMLMMQDVSV